MIKNRAESLINNFTSFNIFGFIKYDIFDEWGTDKKYIIDELKLAQNTTYSDFMLEMLDEIESYFWIIVIPLGSFLFFMEKWHIKKYLDKNQEYLI